MNNGTVPSDVFGSGGDVRQLRVFLAVEGTLAGF